MTILDPATFVELNETERRGLLEIDAACIEKRRFDPKGLGYVRGKDLSGTPQERSSKNTRRLMALGLVEGHKRAPSSQAPLYFRLTPQGQAWVDAWKNGRLPCYNERDGIHRAALAVVNHEIGGLDRLREVMAEAVERAEHRKSRYQRRAAAE